MTSSLVDFALSAKAGKQDYSQVHQHSAGTAQVQSGRFSIYSAAELGDEDFRQDYWISGVLAVDQPAILGGGKKTLKTNIAIALTVSLAAGTPFLGTFPVERTGRVLMFSAESGMAANKSSMERIARASGLSLGDLGGAYLSPDAPRFTSAKDMAEVAATVTGNGIDVVIIDPAYLCMEPGGNESSLFAMGSQLRKVNDAIVGAGAQLILVHHCRKNQNEPHARPELGDIAFAGFAEFARQWILLGRRSRYDEGSGRHELWMSVGGSAGHSSLTGLNISEGVHGHRHWDVETVTTAEIDASKLATKSSAKADKQAVLAAEHQKSVIEALAACHDMAATKTTIRDMTGINMPKIDAAIASLQSSGAIIAAMVPAGKRKVNGFRIAPNQDQ